METIKQILIVDDEAEFVNTVKRHLKRKGFSINSASDGKDACHKIQDAVSNGLPFDLVITDDIMPNLGGIELLEWIKETQPGTSVIVVSGFGHTDMVMETIRPEMDDYAQKPLTPQKMMRLIGNIDLKRRRRPAAQQEGETRSRIKKRKREGPDVGPYGRGSINRVSIRNFASFPKKKIKY